MITCQGCGTPNPASAEYCIKCARKLDAATQESVLRQREEHTATGINWTRVLVAIVMFIVVVAVLAFVVFHGL